MFAAAALLIAFSAGLGRWIRKASTFEGESSAMPTEQELANQRSLEEDTPVVTASETAGQLLSFYVLSDLHISLDDPQTSRKLKQALDDLKESGEKVEAIVITGDLTDTGTERDYKELRRILSGYKLPPLAANMGNHDYYTIWLDKNNAWKKETMPNGKSDALSREQFMKFFNYQKPYNEMTVNGYTILLLSQETYVQEKPEVGEGAWYSDEQLAWFKERLAAVYQEGKPVFVMIHQPLPPVGQDGGSHQLIRAKRFREILKPYRNVFVFCGHRHQDFQNGTAHYVKETFHLFHNSSVGRPLNRNYQQEAKDKAQGLYVQVYKDKVVLRGREFEKRTFIPEADWTIPLQQETKNA
jgi:3',5'-cyclic AMP phosphodiesterase CpdA